MVPKTLREPIVGLEGKNYERLLPIELLYDVKSSDFTKRLGSSVIGVNELKSKGLLDSHLGRLFNDRTSDMVALVIHSRDLYNLPITGSTRLLNGVLEQRTLDFNLLKGGYECLVFTIPMFTFNWSLISETTVNRTYQRYYEGWNPQSIEDNLTQALKSTLYGIDEPQSLLYGQSLFSKNLDCLTIVIFRNFSSATNFESVQLGRRPLTREGGGDRAFLGSLKLQTVPLMFYPRYVFEGPSLSEFYSPRIHPVRLDLNKNRQLRSNVPLLGRNPLSLHFSSNKEVLTNPLAFAGGIIRSLIKEVDSKNRPLHYISGDCLDVSLLGNSFRDETYSSRLKSGLTNLTIELGQQLYKPFIQELSYGQVKRNLKMYFCETPFGGDVGKEASLVPFRYFNFVKNRYMELD